MAHETPKNRPSASALALSVASGLLVVFSLAPHDHWWMAWFALVPMLVALRGTTLKQAAICGLVMGSVTNYGAFHWLTVLMNDFSNLGFGTYLVMAVMALYQCVPFLLWAMLLRVTSPTTEGPGRYAVMFVAAISFPVFEFFYPIVFPWYLAVTQHSRPELIGVVDLAGTGLLTLAIVVVNLCLARCLLPLRSGQSKVWPLDISSRERWGLMLVAIFVLGFCYGYSSLRNRQIVAAQERAEKLHLGLVQPNHWIDSVGALDALHHYQRMTSELVQEVQQQGEKLDLILWPESAVRTPVPPFRARSGKGPDVEPQRYPFDLAWLQPGLTEPASTLTQERVPPWEMWSVQRGHRVPMLFGTTMEDTDPEAVGALPGGPALYNCGVLIDENGTVLGIAPKVKLLLFGETIPLAGVFPVIYQLLPMASALVPGTEAVVLDFRQARLGMMICYEDLLPWFHYDLAQQNPDVLLNLTNDAWFGKTAEAVSHLSLAKFRSVEGRVALIRSTPTGVSAVVDATGAVVAEIAMDEEGTLTYPVPLLQIKTGWERFGDSVVWFGLLVVLGFFIWKYKS